MNAVYIIMILATYSRAGQDVPYSLKAVTSGQDVGAVNANGTDISSRSLDYLTKTVTPQYCPSGQVLANAYYTKNGATVGGTCTTSGDVSQASANNFTSTNTFGNSSVYTTTASYSSIVNGLCSDILVSSFSAVGGMSYTNIVSSYTYTLYFSILQNTSNAELRARMDNDATAGNYRSVVTDNNSGGGAGSEVDNGAAGYIKITGGTDIILAGADISGYCTISSGVNRSKFYWNCQRSYFNQASNFDGGINTARYAVGASDPHTINLFDSAGTMTGYVILQACNQKVGY